jgi:hypothetical protein
MMTSNATEKDPEFYRKRMLVKTKRGLQVMTMRKLRAAVLAGKADSWMVCDADENGVVQRIICPYCHGLQASRGTSLTVGI